METDAKQMQIVLVECGAIQILAGANFYLSNKSPRGLPRG